MTDSDESDSFGNIINANLSTLDAGLPSAEQSALDASFLQSDSDSQPCDDARQCNESSERVALDSRDQSSANGTFYIKGGAQVDAPASNTRIKSPTQEELMSSFIVESSSSSEWDDKAFVSDGDGGVAAVSSYNSHVPPASLEGSRTRASAAASSSMPA
eukprot:6172702-Pleurochrysis_carterae.AAC.1